ncbi:unnamed protein product, partial [Brenthis ino]
MDMVLIRDEYVAYKSFRPILVAVAYLNKKSAREILQDTRVRKLRLERLKERLEGWVDGRLDRMPDARLEEQLDGRLDERLDDLIFSSRRFGCFHCNHGHTRD